MWGAAELWLIDAIANVVWYDMIYDGNQILAKMGQKITKMAITSVVSNISVHNLVFREGLFYLEIHMWHYRTQGIKGRYHGNQLKGSVQEQHNRD